MTFLRERSAMDIVVLVWGFTVAATLLIGVLGVVIGKVLHPEMNVSAGAETIATIVATMTGFIGGRAVGKWEERKNGSAT